MDKSTGRGPSRGPDPGPFPSLDHACSQPASLLELEVPFPEPHLVAPSDLFSLFISTLFHKGFEATFGKERDDRWRR